MSSGLDFERQVHALLKNMGFEAEITKASGDGGIDIIAHSKEHITGGKYIIQCKDWSKPVGEPPVRDLYGVVTAENANKGILITTSTFTAPAINFAAGKPLELIDGTKFNQLLSKYSLAGIEGEASSTADDERIKVLTEQLDRNPKNILVMKELADIYLLQGDYNRAAELYETIIPLKPTVETERLNNAYTGGLINYGVALAKLKRYDEAIKMFQQASSRGCLQEAKLIHYLGLYDIATELYQKVKSIANSAEIFDEFIESAYLQMPLAYPNLSPALSQDGTNDAILIPLETALQRAAQEGKFFLYAPLIDAASDISVEFSSFIIDLLQNDPLSSQAEEETTRNAWEIVHLIEISKKVISEYGYIIDIPTENPLQDSYKQWASDSLEELRRTCHTLENDVTSILSDNYNNEGRKRLEKQQKVTDQCEKELRKVEEEYEALIDHEKAEWREKLRNTIYANGTPSIPT